MSEFEIILDWASKNGWLFFFTVLLLCVTVLECVRYACVVLAAIFGKEGKEQPAPATGEGRTE